MELAVFGGGCFWHIERAFSRIDGVLDTRAGYMGGHTPEPTYQQVCDGDTGHIEVVEVQFDPARVSYAALVDAFLAMHDPTSWDAQGDDAQSDTAQEHLERAADRYHEDIVTEIRAVETFWVAEDDHQGFADRHDL